MINPFLNHACFDNSCRTLFVRPYTLALQNVRSAWHLRPELADSLPIKNLYLRKVTYYVVGLIFLIPIINTIALIVLRCCFSRYRYPNHMRSSVELDVINQRLFKGSSCELSIELHSHIFNYVSPEEAARNSCVSRVFYVFAHSSHMWKKFCVSPHRNWVTVYSLTAIVNLRIHDLEGNKNWKDLYLQYEMMNLKNHQDLEAAKEGFSFMAATIRQRAITAIPSQKALLVLSRVIKGEYFFREEQLPQFHSATIKLLTNVLSQIESLQRN